MFFSKNEKNISKEEMVIYILVKEKNNTKIIHFGDSRRSLKGPVKKICLDYIAFTEINQYWYFLFKLYPNSHNLYY